MPDAAVMQFLVDYPPWGLALYLVFLLLTKALDRLNKRSRKNGRPGDHEDVTRTDSETETDAADKGHGGL